MLKISTNTQKGELYFSDSATKHFDLSLSSVVGGPTQWYQYVAWWDQDPDYI